MKPVPASLPPKYPGEREGLAPRILSRPRETRNGAGPSPLPA
jgi:hypothetical protein